MVARADTSRLTPPASVAPGSSGQASPSVAAAGAMLAAGLVAIGCLAAPSGPLESLVVASGMAALVNAAAPPLGFTARAVLALGGGGLVAAVVWAVLVLVAGDRRVPAMPSTFRLPAFRLPALRPRRAPGAPTVRRADSHPDAPPRPPILAERDLGLPFLSVTAPDPAPPAEERALPADLETALAAIDPAAIPDVPREPVRPVPPLAVVAPPPRPAVAPPASPPLAPGERIDSIELGADVRDQPESIESLLARLERGARRRADPVPVPAAAPPAPEPVPSPVEPRAGSLEETLGSLRRLATRG